MVAKHIEVVDLEEVVVVDLLATTLCSVKCALSLDTRLWYAGTCIILSFQPATGVPEFNNGPNPAQVPLYGAPTYYKQAPPNV